MSLALTGCEQGVGMTVSQSSNGKVRIAIASLSSDFTACVDSASVYLAGRQDDPSWELGRTDATRCIHDISVGEPVIGFAQRSSAPLLSNGTYCVEVNGPGFNVRRGFATQSGAVKQDDENETRC